MRSTIHGPGEFLLKSKKPHIQALIARCYEMSEQDIENLDEKPDIRRGLITIKRRQDNKDALERAEKIADLMTSKNHPDQT